jgi:quinoprotein dehydrogenase-associated probable ABC transporter substrate-binding protein
MCSRFRSALLLAAAMGLAVPAFAGERVLRVCADPDNLPYSRADGSGFENRIAEVVAAEMHAKLEYAWMPLRRGFVRKTVGKGLCDVFIGVPAHFERVTTTRPYYRSTYVFVMRAPDGVHSFDDPRLARVRVGVQLIGDDLAATPPGHALALRGATRNVEGFPVFGDGPAAGRLVHAVSSGRLDVGLVWGPQAGYFAAKADPPLLLAAAHAPPELAGMPFEFSIAMGVRRGDTALRDALDRAIERRRADIDAILAAYHVPRTDAPSPRGSPTRWGGSTAEGRGEGRGAHR